MQSEIKNIPIPTESTNMELYDIEKFVSFCASVKYPKILTNSDFNLGGNKFSY